MRAAIPLKELLAGSTRLAVLGVGSELRADDGAGVLVARRLSRAFPARADFLAVEGGSAPENLTGVIAEFGPSHVAIVDCADLGLEPGGVSAVRVEGIGGLSASTHGLPLKIVADYLASRCACRIVAVGIQPERLDFDGRMSRAARAAALRVARALAEAVRGMDARARGGGSP